MRLAAALEELRRVKNLTIQTTAAFLGVPTKTLTSWELGLKERKPKGTEILRLFSVVSVPVSLKGDIWLGFLSDTLGSAAAADIQNTFIEQYQARLGRDILLRVEALDLTEEQKKELRKALLHSNEVLL